MARRECPDWCSAPDAAAECRCCLDRFVGCAQAAGVIDRDHRLSRDLARERDEAIARREHGLTGRAGQVDTAMTRQPVVLGFVERAHNGWSWPQRPVELTRGRTCGWCRANEKCEKGQEEQVG